jgi:hypothetical protein
MAADLVISALERQVECYQRLAKLGEVQHEHVQHSATDQLLKVLGMRQEVLDQIVALERTLASAKKQWGQYLAGLEAAARARAEELLAQTRGLLEHITAADRNDALVLQQRKLTVGRQLGQTAAARQVNRSYRAAAYGPGRTNMDVQR